MSKQGISQEAKPELIEPNSSILLDSSTLGKKNPLRILYVDSDLSFLKVTKKSPDKQNNFEVDTATSVAEALSKLDKLETCNYDIIVSDYEMRDRTGLDFLKALRDQRTAWRS